MSDASQTFEQSIQDAENLLNHFSGRAEFASREESRSGKGDKLLKEPC